VVSQSNEDSIIAAIFKTIGEGGKRFVEFGCGPGNQNNTIELLHRGWHGTWCEPRKKVYDSAKRLWAGYPVDIKRRVITPDKVNVIVKDPLDFLSIDIDGNDYAVWKAITARPRVVCIEYDAVSGTPLGGMIGLGVIKGYRWVVNSASEVNAFFIREDIDGLVQP
jgi:hypothetical protein